MTRAGRIRTVLLAGPVAVATALAAGALPAHAATAAAPKPRPSAAGTDATVDGGSLEIDGAAKTLTIPTAGDTGQLTFAGTLGQRIQFRTSGSTFPGDVYWRVLDPGGNVVIGTHNGNNLVDTTTLPGTGTYVFEVDPAGTLTGSITAQAWSVPADVDGGSLTVDGAARTLTIPNSGQNGSMTFAATGGERIQLRASGSTFPGDVYWRVLDPRGDVVIGSHNGNNLIDTTTLPMSGTYTIEVDPSGTVTGSIAFQVWSVPADVDGGSFAIDGPARTITIPNRGQNGSMTFTATANERIQMQTTGSTFAADVWWRVLDPGGNVVIGSHQGNNWVDTTTLPVTGTYVVEVDPSGTAAGSITVQAWSVPADVNGGSITIDGDAKTLTIPNSGQNGSLTFSGTLGQRIRVQTSGSTFPGDVYWRVLDPRGDAVIGWQYPNRTSDAITLPMTGTYVVAVDPQGFSTGAITVQVTTAS